jgi:hypothetical protein
MTDLDHFAAAALTGLLADSRYSAHEPDTIAVGAYNVAESMVSERVRRLQIRRMDDRRKDEPTRK